MLALIVAVDATDTIAVRTLTVAEVLPAGMMTFEGTVAEGELLDNEITRPPWGAGEPILTVPMVSVPPFTAFGFSEKEVRTGGVTISDVGEEVPSIRTVMVAVTGVATGLVRTQNVPADLPSGTKTDVGTVTPLVSLESFKVRPPAGALPQRENSPLAVVPPGTK